MTTLGELAAEELHERFGFHENERREITNIIDTLHAEQCGCERLRDALEKIRDLERGRYAGFHTFSLNPAKIAADALAQSCQQQCGYERLRGLLQRFVDMQNAWARKENNLCRFETLKEEIEQALKQPCQQKGGDSKCAVQQQSDNIQSIASVTSASNAAPKSNPSGAASTEKEFCEWWGEAATRPPVEAWRDLGWQLAKKLSEHWPDVSESGIRDIVLAEIEVWQRRITKEEGYPVMNKELTEAIERLEHECLITAEPESGFTKDILLVCAALAPLQAELEQTREKLSIVARAVDIAEAINEAQTDQQAALSASLSESMAYITLEQTEKELDKTKARLATAEALLRQSYRVNRSAEDSDFNGAVDKYFDAAAKQP